jgi:uncharacterized membrane protein
MFDTRFPESRARSLLFAVLATLVLYGAHHAYGAVRYATPWRHHAAFVALAVAGVSYACFRAHLVAMNERVSRVAGWAFGILSLVMPVMAIGIFEGFYNHVVKDVVFFAGISAETFARMFPPPAYERPNDLVFEMTGVLQVVPAVVAGRACVSFLADLGRKPRREEVSVERFPRPDILG